MRTQQGIQTRMRFEFETEGAGFHQRVARWRWRGPGVPRCGPALWSASLASRVDKVFEVGSG